VRWTIIITMLLALATGTARAEPAADTGDPAAAGTATTTEGADAPEAETEGETGKVDEELDVLESDKEITVTATRTERDTFELPHAVFIATREEVDDVGRIVGLKTISRRDPAVWYDERTYSTTDPIIRGFAGFNLLTLVDGNTLSTLWGEGGFGSDDMYGKIDPDTIERVEVVFGPNSVLYGSNALGAVINVITRDSPIDFTGGGWQFGGRIKGDWGSAASGYAARGEVFGASPDLKFLIGGSYRDFQDVRGGRGLGILDPTEFEDLNWDIATTWKITDGRELRATYQHVERDPTFRYYRPHQDNRNDRRALAFTYRDTARDMPWDSLEARLYWQLKKDRRGFYTDATRTELQRTGEATTETWAAGLTATKDVGGGHVLTGGLAFELTMGDSPDDEQFTYIWPGPKRRDAPLSDWYDFGVFLQDEWTIVDDVTVTGSIRYDYFIFETDVDEYYVPPVGDPEDDEYRDTQGAFTGGLGVVYRATPEIRLFGSWARGFRQGAPNFGLRQLGDGVLVPNQLLNPTTSDNFEIGVKGRYEGFTFEAIGYYSLIQNWQGDLRPTTWNGQDWYDFNGNGERDDNEDTVKQVEGGDAWVGGIELRGSLRPHYVWDTIPRNWMLWGGFCWNKGRVDATDEHPIEEPLRHTQPMRGLLGLRWDYLEAPKTGLYVEVIADMVARFDQIPSDRVEKDLAWREDPQDGSSPLLRSFGGTPGYTKFDIYAGVNLCPNASLRVAVENFTDRNYRVAHSRMDAPGIDFLVTLDVRF
jgi:hemoglobin/transferrin/lactoferrin receptor protein